MRAFFAAAILGLGLAGASAETLKIGLVLSPHGKSAAAVRQLRDGVELALARSQRKIGGRDVELVVLPAGEAPSEAQRIEAFAKQEKPQLMIFSSPEERNTTLLKGLSDAGIIVLMPSLGVADLAGKRCLANVFVSGGQSDQVLDTIGAYVDSANLKNLVIVHAESLSASADTLRRGIKSEVLRQIALPDAAEGIEAHIEKLLLDKPHAIVLHASSAFSARFLSALRAAPGGQDPVVIWPGGWDESDLPALGKLAEGLLSAGGWAQGLEGTQNTEFTGAFEGAFGYAPSSAAVFAYDAIRMLDAGLAKVPEPYAAAALRDALHGAALESPRGSVALSNNNFPIQDFYIKRAEAGPDGTLRTKPVSKVFAQFGDDYAAECPLR